jgi:hypothetical protein
VPYLATFVGHGRLSPVVFLVVVVISARNSADFLTTIIVT